MALVNTKGEPKGRDDDYKIKSKGLFVISAVRDLDYAYNAGKYDGVVRNVFDKVWVPMCKESVDDLKETLKLADKPDNLLEPTKLIRDDNFKKLKEVIFKKWNAMKVKPSFLMFFLLAPSFESGQFLLDEGIDKSCTTCPNGNHKLTGKGCYGRRISDLVRSIQQAEDADGKGFAGIPKIFVIQTVSGLTYDSMQVESKAGPPKVKADDYIPRGSDTFVFYVHASQKASWLAEHGKFYLISELCGAIKKLNGNIANCNEMLHQMAALWQLSDTELHVVVASKGPVPPVKAEKIVPAVNHNTLQTVNTYIARELGVKLELNANSLTDSWFDNMCMTVAANISKYVKKVEEEENKERDTDDKQSYDHMRAHISSTLRDRLSMLDILRQNVQK